MKLKIKTYKFTKICPECGAKFKTNRANRIYCKQPCQFKAWSDSHPRKMVRV